MHNYSDLAAAIPPDGGSRGLVATYASFPLSEPILESLAVHAEAQGYIVGGCLAPLDPEGSYRRTRELLRLVECGELPVVIMDTSTDVGGEGAGPLREKFRKAIRRARLVVVDLDE